ncbi:hypothetical protein BV898_18592 [Hypsibius exemplaris]|uniref:HAT C-terminal dimerisation domain-containing protein n=1 Tax=Hypsibius exemplaris TaxID=2072580 RepID=A0A9X6NHJ6_HYPEX|nr:hypothetical protein BV898_18592 [Hypsibius exemplaris]
MKWISDQCARWGDHSKTNQDSLELEPDKCLKNARVSDDFEFFVGLRSAKTRDAGSNATPISVELTKYANEESLTEHMSTQNDPRLFWAKHFTMFPELSAFALDLLAIPASSAPVERLFSTSGVAVQGRCARLGGLNLEWKVLIQRNLHFIPEANLGVGVSNTILAVLKKAAYLKKATENRLDNLIAGYTYIMLSVFGCTGALLCILAIFMLNFCGRQNILTSVRPIFVSLCICNLIYSIICAFQAYS